MKASLLVSIVNIKAFLRNERFACYDEWVLDSGAFTAMSKGITIDVEWYIRQCQKLIECEKPPTEVFALDVIGDLMASNANAEAMHRVGIPGIPTVHFGASKEDVRAFAKDHDKIALGGMAGRLEGTNHGQRTNKNEKRRWLAQCFESIWPKRVHGFGCTDEDLLNEFPFETVDSTSWHLQPSRYGTWKQFGKLQGVRGDLIKKGMIGQIRYCLKLEKRIRSRWKETVELNGINPFRYRFATSGSIAELKPFNGLRDLA